MKIVFNYDNSTITVFDGSYKEDFCINDKKYRDRYKVGEIWPLIVLHNLLSWCYPYSINNYCDFFGEVEFGVYSAEECNSTNGKMDVGRFRLIREDTQEIEIKNFNETISKSVRFLNNEVLGHVKSRFGGIKIIRSYNDKYDRELGDEEAKGDVRIKKYILDEVVSEIQIEWDTIGNGNAVLDEYGVSQIGLSRKLDDTFIPPKNMIKHETLINQGDYIEKVIEKDRIEGSHIVSSTSGITLWNMGVIKSVAKEYGEPGRRIDIELLPKVKDATSVEPYTNLAEFITNEYINLEKYANKNSFLLLEGNMGSGKTYALNYVVNRMCYMDHIAITVPAYALHNNAGAQTLASFLCKYMEGDTTGNHELKLRSLARKATKEQKLMICIDCIDEVFSGTYESLAREIGAILSLGNPNVYIVLATRNASVFMSKSRIMEMDGVENCINLYNEDLDYAIVASDDKDLREIMLKSKETRTPLFVSYYREVRSMYDALYKDDKRTENLGEYGEEIDRSKLRKIDNFYDLFKVRTWLLKTHAESDKVNSAVYSLVLPYIAYSLCFSDNISFGIERIGQLFKDNTSDTEAQWVQGKFAINYPLLKEMSNDEIADVVCNTGLIRTTWITDENNDDTKSNSGLFAFEHIEYMHYLAALFASELVADTERKNDSTIVLDKCINRTSFYSDESDLSRPDKVGVLSFAYYLLLILEEKKLKSTFDSRMLRLCTNVGYEKKYDVWKQSEPLMKKMLNNWMGYIEKGKSLKSEYADWKLINSTNATLYNMITAKTDDDKKQGLLDSLHNYITICAGIAMHETYKAIGDIDNYYSEHKDNKSKIKGNDVFLLRVMDRLISTIEEKGNIDPSNWDFPADMIGRIYSDIGAVNQEKAKYWYEVITKEPDNENAIGKPIHYLELAEDYHVHTMRYRRLIKERVQGNIADVSLIRSYITLGTDAYYKGRFEGDAGKAKSYFRSAVNDYYKEALALQGYDLSVVKKCSYDVQFPIKTTLDISEKPGEDAEPHVILLRVAGCIFEEWERCDNRSDEVASNLLKEQFEMLKAAYLFVFGACINNNDDRKLESSKLEIHSSEVDMVWSDVKKRYIHSFNMLIGKDRIDALDLLNRIVELYKALHEHADIGGIIDEENEFVITTNNNN